MENTGTLMRPGGMAAQPEVATGTITFIGTATVLLRYAGFTILTDPNFLHRGEQVHLGYGLRSTRRTNPAMELDDLPPLDFVVLSHMHEDHFDRVVARHLDRSLPIVTTPEAADTLAGIGFNATRPLPTWAATQFSKGGYSVHITAMPGLHAPRIVSLLFPSVMGSMIEFTGPSGKTLMRLYVSGDTLIFDEFYEIPKRYSSIDLALLHLGGTRVAGIPATMDAKQGIEALRIIQADTSIPIHYGDYPIFRSPLRDFLREVDRAGLAHRVEVLRRGVTYSFRVPEKRCQ